MASSNRVNRPTSEQIKAVREKMRKSFKTQEAKAQWKQVYEGCHLEEAYGYDPNKKSSKSKIGKGAITHILDSDGIREELEDQTPINHPHIIPSDCDLTFFYDCDLSQHHPLCAPLCLADLFDNIHFSHEMKNIFNDRLYSAKLIISIGDTEHEFWVKSFKQSGSGFVRQFGIQISKYIMRYRPVLYVELGPITMVLRGKNIGIGFCNLAANNKGVGGHKMLQFETETMQQITIEFHGVKTHFANIRDIALKVQKYEQKGGKITPTAEEPLVLFNGAQYNNNVAPQQTQPQPQQSQMIMPEVAPLNSPMGYDNNGAYGDAGVPQMGDSNQNMQQQHGSNMDMNMLQGAQMNMEPNIQQRQAMDPNTQQQYGSNTDMNQYNVLPSPPSIVNHGQWFPPCISPVPMYNNFMPVDINDESQSPLSITTADYTAFPQAHYPPPCVAPQLHQPQHPFLYNLPSLSPIPHDGNGLFGHISLNNNPSIQHRTFQHMNGYNHSHSRVHRRIMNERSADEAHLKQLNREVRIRELRARMNDESMLMPVIGEFV